MPQLVVNVVEESTGMPVPGAVVHLSPGDATATSDADGNARFDNLQPGFYQASVTATPAGFLPSPRPLEASAISDTAPATLELPISLSIGPEGDLSDVALAAQPDTGATGGTAFDVGAGADGQASPGAAGGAPSAPGPGSPTGTGGDAAATGAALAPGAVTAVPALPNGIDTTATGRLVLKVVAESTTIALTGAVADLKGPIVRAGVEINDVTTVDDLPAGLYLVSMRTAPPEYALLDPTTRQVTVAASGESQVTFNVRSLRPSTKGGIGLGGVVSAALVVGLGIAAALSQWVFHQPATAFANAVLAAGLAALSLAGGRRGGLFRPILGADGRASTSKTQVGLWTLALAWALAYLTGRAMFQGQSLGTLLPDSLWDDYLVVLGGPFAAAVFAKGIVSQRVQNGTLQKTSDDPTQASLGSLVQNDAGNTDLVDSQYLLFNLVALAYFSVQLGRSHVLPPMPGPLLSMTGASAALYAANKAADRNKPSITGISPLTVRPGDQMTITGANLRPRGSDDSAHAKVDLDGYGPIQVVTETDTTVVAVVPPGAPVGQKNVTVTTAAGGSTDPWPVTVELEQPKIIGTEQPHAVPGQPLTLYGERFRSALSPDAQMITVWIGEQPLAVPAPSRHSTGYDQLSVPVPSDATGNQLTLQVQTSSGVRSAPITVPLVAAPALAVPGPATAPMAPGAVNPAPVPGPASLALNAADWVVTNPAPVPGLPGS